MNFREIDTKTITFLLPDSCKDTYYQRFDKKEGISIDKKGNVTMPLPLYNEWCDWKNRTEIDVAELITRRRRQVLVHSIIYYRYNDNIISDSTWSDWAKELYDLQRKYPETASICPLAKEFKDFDYSTGSNLPLGDPWGNEIALRLLKMREKGEL